MQIVLGTYAWAVVLFIISAALQSSAEKLRRGLSVQRSLSANKEREGATRLRLRQTPTLVQPQPNDTISAMYWSQVDALLAAAGRSTPRPLTQAEIQQAEAAPNKWNQVTAERQPYDTQIGAALLRGIEEEPTKTPPPSQAVVSESFVAHCPMLVFGSQLYIRAPHCSETMGAWINPNTGHNFLRWQDSDDDTNVHWGVDSIMYGNGSTTFATSDLQASLAGTSTRFSLKNCLGVERYTIEERITKVDSMGYSDTTWRMHDTSYTGKAFFMKYLIWSPNGTMVAETNLFRMNARDVNITMTPRNNAPGTLIATAHRNGHWDRDGWRQCTLTSTGQPRQWQVNFMISQRELQTVATVMDLRVAAAALINIMALRDEHRNQETGLDEQGEGLQLWNAVSFWLWIAIAGGCFLCGLCCLQLSGGADWIAKKLNRVQDSLLPKRPAKARLPSFHASY